MDRLLRSIASFHAGHGRLLQPHLETLAQDGQRPQVMVITCADSRILLDPLVNSEPGIVFALRNVGNLVPDDDSTSVASAVDYAISALHVPDIVVMGHAECGAMKALLGPPAGGSVGEWLKYGEESLVKFRAEPCDASLSDYDCLSQKNVLVQAERVRAMASVQASSTTVHAWWWDMSNAAVLAYDGKSSFVDIAEAYAPQLTNSTV